MLCKIVHSVKGYIFAEDLSLINLSKISFFLPKFCMESTPSFDQILLISISSKFKNNFAYGANSYLCWYSSIFIVMYVEIWKWFRSWFWIKVEWKAICMQQFVSLKLNISYLLGFGWQESDVLHIFSFSYELRELNIFYIISCIKETRTNSLDVLFSWFQSVKHFKNELNRTTNCYNNSTNNIWAKHFLYGCSCVHIPLPCEKVKSAVF